MYIYIYIDMCVCMREEASIRLKYWGQDEPKKLQKSLYKLPKTLPKSSQDPRQILQKLTLRALCWALLTPRRPQEPFKNEKPDLNYPTVRPPGP